MTTRTFPTMDVAITTDEPDRFVITVAHHIAQSYSRSVDPRAMRAAGEHAARRSDRGANWFLVHVDRDDDRDVTASPDRCTSTFLFTKDRP